MQTDLVENLEGRLRVTRELAAAPQAGQADALARRWPGLIIMPSEITGKAAPLARRDDYQRRETEFTVALGTHAPDGTLHLAVALDGAGWHPAAWREPDAQPPALVVQVGSTQLRYQLRCIDDLQAMLKERGDWVPLGNADEQKPAADGTVEAWGRSAATPVGGWYGLKKGLRGRFGNYVPPVLEVLGLAEVKHNARNNRMRAV